MKGIVYQVKEKLTGKVVKIGSTVQTLKKRESGYCRENKYFKLNYELVHFRTVEHDDPDFFMFYLRAVENLEIVRQHTWLEEGGLNQVAPLAQLLFSAARHAEWGRMGGKVASVTNKRRGNLEAFYKAGGRAQGRINAANGHLKKLSNTFSEGRYKHIPSDGEKSWARSWKKWFRCARSMACK